MTLDNGSEDGYSSNVTERPLKNFVSAWSRASNHMVNSVMEANRATLALFGVHDRDDVRSESSDELEYTRADWHTERTVDAREEISVGDTVRFSKTVEQEDVAAFAAASGDTNRLHLDDEFAEETRFGRRIVHGTLVSGLISAALARLPGLTIYLSQDVKFLKPVDIGSELTAVVEVVEDLGDDRYLLSTDVVTEDGESVIEGEAVVLIDTAPEDESVSVDETAQV
jgi:acyl dehydratase